MRIGLLTTSYPRFHQDLAGSFVAEMARWLASHSQSVEVLAPAPDHPARYLSAPCFSSGFMPAALEQRLEQEQPGTHLQVRQLRYALRPRLFYGAGAPDNLSDWRRWSQVPLFGGRLALECWQRSRHWDGVISHWLLPCGLIAAQASRKLPHLAVAHSSDVHLLAQLPLAAHVLPWLARPRSQLVLTSESLRPILLRLARSSSTRRLIEKAVVLRMGVPPQTSEPSPALVAALRQRVAPQGEVIVLFIGRLISVKGVDLLLRASKGVEGLVLVVIGDGPQRSHLEQQARALSLQAHFVGLLLGEVKEAWLRAGHLLVLPSRRLPDGRCDSAPVTLLEGMREGLPVLASCVGGNQELIIEGQNGLLVPPDNVEALQRALVRLVHDAMLRQKLGQAARTTAEVFTWDRIGPRFLALLQDL